MPPAGAGVPQGGARRWLLCLDTAGPRCAAALYDMGAGQLLARAEPDIGRGHAERLMGIVADVLAEAGAGYEDLARIAVLVGPGSFTGIRVGVAAARGLALALSIPAVGVDALEALAEPLRPAGAPVLSVIDAKRGEVYAALFGAPGLSAALFGPAALDTVSLPEALAEAGLGHGAPMLVGSGAGLAAEAFGTRPHRLMEGTGAVDIAAIARIAAARPAAGPPRPLYLRGADAKPQTGPRPALRPPPDTAQGAGATGHADRRG